MIDQLEKKCAKTNFKKEYAKLSSTQRYICKNLILVDVINEVLDLKAFQKDGKSYIENNKSTIAKNLSFF